MVNANFEEKVKNNLQPVKTKTYSITDLTEDQFLAIITLIGNTGDRDSAVPMYHVYSDLCDVAEKLELSTDKFSLNDSAQKRIPTFHFVLT